MIKDQQHWIRSSGYSGSQCDLKQFSSKSIDLIDKHCIGQEIKLFGPFLIKLYTSSSVADEIQIKEKKMPSSLDDYEVISTIGSGSYGTCKKIRRKKDSKVCSKNNYLNSQILSS